MSDSNDQLAKNKLKIGYNKMLNKCSERWLYETQSNDLNPSIKTMPDTSAIKIEKFGDQDLSALEEFIRLSSQTKQEIETYSDQDTSNCEEFMGLSTQTENDRKDLKNAIYSDQDASNSEKIRRLREAATRRNRLYRERHRDEINQRRRAIRQHKKFSQQISTPPTIQKINEIDENTDATLTNQLKLNTQTDKTHYERHKEEISERISVKNLNENSSKGIHTTLLQFFNSQTKQDTELPSIETYREQDTSNLQKIIHLSSQTHEDTEVLKNKTYSEQNSTHSEELIRESIKQDTSDNVTKSDQDISSSDKIKRLREAATKRNRLYRERHRDEINQRRREIRQRKKYAHQIYNPAINEIEQNTQRQKRYKEKHKEEIKQRVKDKSLNENS